MAQTIISTVGLSLLLDYYRSRNEAPGETLARLDCCPGDAVPSAEDAQLSHALTRHLQQALAAGRGGDVSAEMNGILRLEPAAGTDFVFFASDTLSARLCAEALADAVARHYETRPEVRVIPGIQVADAEVFRDRGFRGLLAALSEYSAATPEELANELVLNVTGGFKALLPVMTMIGNVLGHRVVYVFERSEQLIELPPLPIDVNVELWGKYSHVLRDYAESGRREEPAFFSDDDRRYFSPFFERIGAGWGLSYLGDLFWRRYQIQKLSLLKQEKGRTCPVRSTGGHSNMWGGDKISCLEDVPEADARAVLARLAAWPVVKDIVFGAFNGPQGQAWPNHFIELKDPALQDQRGIVFGVIRGRGKKHNWQEIKVTVQEGFERDLWLCLEETEDASKRRLSN